MLRSSQLKMSITFLIRIVENPFQNHVVGKIKLYKLVLERVSEDQCEKSYGVMKFWTTMHPRPGTVKKG